MQQSACLDNNAGARHALHVAIIMDGNGRWATERGRARRSGHRAGAAAVRRTVEAAATLGIETLTLYAFSSDNWKRPPDEVTSLMRLLLVYLRTETATCVERGVRVTVIGRRDRVPGLLRQAIAETETLTAGGRTLHLRLALDYSARDAIVSAASRARPGARLTRSEFSHLLGEAMHARETAPDVDLLIRTGGEQRLSDFLLWECAYAELYFTPRLWPDFDRDALSAALEEFARRQRRFGGVEAVRGAALSATK
jgi:undecaprenyl diphosphate synthase